MDMQDYQSNSLVFFMYICVLHTYVLLCVIRNVSFLKYWLFEEFANIYASCVDPGQRQLSFQYLKHDIL